MLGILKVTPRSPKSHVHFFEDCENAQGKEPRDVSSPLYWASIVAPNGLQNKVDLAYRKLTPRWWTSFLHIIPSKAQNSQAFVVYGVATGGWAGEIHGHVPTHFRRDFPMS